MDDNDVPLVVKHIILAQPHPMHSQGIMEGSVKHGTMPSATSGGVM